MAATQIVLACCLIVLVHIAVAKQPDQRALPAPSAKQCDAFMNMATQLLEGLSLQFEKARDLDNKTQATLDACETSSATSPGEVAKCKEDAQAKADQDAIFLLSNQVMNADVGRHFSSYLAKCRSAAKSL